MKKKVLVALISITMVATLVPTASFAAYSDECSQVESVNKEEDVESVNEEMCEAQDDSKNTRTEQREMELFENILCMEDDSNNEGDSEEQEEEKEELIQDYATSIAYVELTDEDENDINMKAQERKTEATINRLEDMSVNEIEEEIENSIKEVAENENCYFLDKGVEYVEEYCPEIIDDIQTEDDIDENVLNVNTGMFLEKAKGSIVSLCGEEVYAAAETKTYKKSKTWTFRPFAGLPMVKEKITVCWNVKGEKITKVKDPNCDITYQKRYIKVVSGHYTKKRIAKDGKTAVIEMKVVYENKLNSSGLYKRHTHRSGVKMKRTGEATFYEL